MTLLLAAAAFCQMTWVPGTLLRRFLGLRAGSRLQGAVWTFVLSLLANYLLVYLLTVLGFYRRWVVLVLLALELALLLAGWRARGGGWRPEWREKPERLRVAWSGRPLQAAWLMLALLLLAQLAGELLAQSGRVFTFVDAAVGWNRFALDWYANRVPVTTWLYPQLLAANWSLVYQVLGTPDLQAAARGVMGLFPLLTALLFIDLGLAARRAAPLMGAVFYLLLLRCFFAPELIGEGLMDIAVSFLAFLVYHTLKEAGQAEAGAFRRASLLAVLFASAAAVTKQSGFAVLLPTLLWLAFQLWRRRGDPATRPIGRLAGAWLLLVALVVLTWFGPRLVLILRGQERVGVREVVQNVHQGRDWNGRLQFAGRQLLAPQGRPLPPAVWGAAALLLLAGLARRPARRLLLGVVLPYGAAWALLYSYDLRNIAPLLPFAALVAAEGAAWLGEWALRSWSRLPAARPPRLMLLAAALAAALVAGLALLPGERLLAGQRAQLRRLGDLKLNEKLYRYYRRHGFAGRVFSKYLYFRLLPELRDHWAPERDSPGVAYYLETVNRPNRQALAELKGKIDSGEYRVLLATGQWRLLQVRRVGERPDPGGEP